MKTKFILHGGFTPGQANEDNANFYAEILKDAPEYARILLVPFAKDDDRILSSTTKVAEEFRKNKWQENIIIDVASPENFLEKLNSSHVAYFHGGASLKLLEALKKYPNLEEYLDGKIIAGESAGANIWARFFFSPKVDSVFEGLGILPIKTIPHYKQEYAGKFTDTDPTLKDVFLPEYSYQVFYK